MYGPLERFLIIIHVLIARANVLKETWRLCTCIFLSDGFVNKGVCVKAHGRRCLFAGLGTQTRVEGE